MSDTVNTADETRGELQVIGARIAALRARLPADSPLAGAAFRLAALAGEIEAEIASHESSAAPGVGAAQEAE